MKTVLEHFKSWRHFGVMAVCAVFVCSVQAVVLPPSFTPLDNPVGLPNLSTSTAVAISADGFFVTGSSDSVGGAYRWSAGGGMVLVDPLPGAAGAMANDMSPDGGTVVGSSGSQAFVWTPSGGSVGLGSLPGGTSWSTASGVSQGGDTVVGMSSSALGAEAFRWTVSGGMVGLGDLPSSDVGSQAFSVSADGSVIVGIGTVGGAPGAKRAVRWTAGNGYNIELLDFSTFCGQESYAWAVSDDGTTVVGEVFTSDGREGFRWTNAGGAELLGDLPGGTHTSAAKGVSADGSLVVGESVTSGIANFSAFVWSRETGMLNLQDVLVNDFGLDLTGWTLASAQDVTITTNGITFVGWGNFDNGGGVRPIRAFKAHIPNMPAPTTEIVTTCPTTWELAAIADPGLSTQAPWEPYDSATTEELSDLAVFDDGNGPALYAAGMFRYAGNSFIGNSIAKWDGQTWSALGIGLGGAAAPLPPWATTLKSLDDGTGAALYVAGNFTIAGGVFARGVAKWDGQTWSAMGSGFAVVRDFLAFDDGTGPAIYAIGMFSTNYGDPFTDGIAKWTGTQWVQVGGGLTNSSGNVSVKAVVFDDGTGAALYVDGDFDTAGGVPIGNDDFAKWDGQNWSAIPRQLGAYVMGVVWDDGTGPAIYFNRSFLDAGPSNIVKWDGQTWAYAFVGPEPYAGSDSSVFKTLVGEMNDGNGSSMFATTSAPSDLHRWDGQDWVLVRPFGCSASGMIQAVAEFDDGMGNGIYMVGKWVSVAGEFARNVAMLRACTIPVAGDCNADGAVDMLDFDFFAGCLSGPGGGSGVGCECSDVDGDGDVDLVDFQVFMTSFSG